MDMTGWFRAVGVLAVCLAFGAEARGVIFGTVKDTSTGMPVSDLVVTATAKSLEGEQIVVTDGLGRYRIPDLPPGTYTVRFEKEMLRPYTRSDVPLREGYSTRLDVSMVPAPDDLYLFIGRCGPSTVDVGSTTTGQDLFLEFGLDRAVGRASEPLGVVRSAEDVALLVAGVLEGTGGLSINGASSFENEYLLDGLSIRDAVLGMEALSLSTELIQDPYVISGGYMPEYGRATGGLLRMDTRGGSNELHGSVFAFWTPGLLEARRASTDTLAQQGDFGATLGGPLLKDRLWFFAGVTPALSRVEQAATFEDTRSLQAVGKLTYLFNNDHNLSLKFITAPSSGEDWRNRTTLTALHHAGAFLDKKVLLDVSAGWMSQQLTGTEVHTLDRYQADARVTWFNHYFEPHVLRAGVNAEWLDYERADSRTPSAVFGGFVQDSYTIIKRATLNVGARYDVQRIDDGDSSGPVTSARLLPRIGLVVDPWADGRMKVFAHFGTFRGVIPLGLVDDSRSAADVTLDPDLDPLTSNEVVTGVEYEVLTRSILGATYTHRELKDGLALVPRAGGSGFVLGNPGSGLVSDSPRAVRTYDAVTVQLRIPYLEGWQAQASYTWSKLTGNYESPFAAWDGLAPTRQRLPLDRPHVIRVFGARQFSLDAASEWQMDVGASYLGASGVLREGAEQRTPWVQSLDAYLGVRYMVRKREYVTFRLDAFNVFNAQEPVQAETRDTVLVRYQQPRQVRLGARYDF